MTGDRTDEVLSAIASLADRINNLEGKVDRIDGRVAALDRIDGRLARVESIIAAIARNTLAPAQCVALGLQDARQGGSGLSDIPPALPRAAKGRE